MTTNGFSSRVPHVNGDSQPNGVPVPQKSLQSDNTFQTNSLIHNLKAKGRDRELSSYAAKHKLAPHFIGGNHLDVATPGSVKDFVANHDGHTVITNVSNRNLAYQGNPSHKLSYRCLSPTMELQLSRKYAPCGNGHMRPSVMKGPYNLPSWQLPRTCKQMRTTFEWQISMSKYVYSQPGRLKPIIESGN